MPFMETVQANIANATTSVTSSNLANAVFATEHSYYSERLRPYASIDELNADDAIPKTSVAYAALSNAFGQPGAVTPIYLGRRLADVSTFTPVVANSETYSLQVECIDTTTNTQVRIDEVSFTSDTDATAEEISAGMVAAFGSLPTPPEASNYAVVDTTGAFTIIAAADREVNITKITKLLDTYTSSETAAELLAEIQQENNEDWYWMTASDHTETFVLAMATAIGATESSNYKKQYRTSYAGLDTLVALPDPAVDVLGKLKQGEYIRAHGEWHNLADSIFPELAAVVYNSQFPAGAETWKFMTNLTTPEIRHPLTNKRLSSKEWGYIADRNASFASKERGVTFMHGGMSAKGTSNWVDATRGSDWLTDAIEVTLLNTLLNAAAIGQPLTMTASKKAIVKERIETKLLEGVNRGFLRGFDPVVVPDVISFEDQVGRILDNVSFTAYLAAKVHFILVNGVLTYKEGEV
ncbi:hypothetical protein NVP1063O_051 [Vibrio phage 1.063.O._10N.261.45.C7]|nr:hypothetical protein NVP1063O_051 [Vibrio phage 1.063.O._10N.261.45.C7]